MTFVLQDVINEIEKSCSLDPIKKLKKENLIKVAGQYGITPAASAKRSHILDLIEDHCIENDIIDEVEEKPTAETAKVLKLKLEFQREERRLVCEELMTQFKGFVEEKRAASLDASISKYWINPVDFSNFFSHDEPAQEQSHWKQAEL